MRLTTNASKYVTVMNKKPAVIMLSFPEMNNKCYWVFFFFLLSWTFWNDTAGPALVSGVEKIFQNVESGSTAAEELSDF